MEVDHIIPLNSKDVCGLHVIWNLQYLPIGANRKKGNKLLQEYALAPRIKRPTGGLESRG